MTTIHLSNYLLKNNPSENYCIENTLIVSLLTCFSFSLFASKGCKYCGMNSFQNWISSLDKKSMAPSFKSSSCIQYGSFSSSRFSCFSSRNAGFAFEKKIQWLRHWILSVLLQWNVHLQLTWTHKCLKNNNSSTAHVAAFVIVN